MSDRHLEAGEATVPGAVADAVHAEPNLTEPAPPAPADPPVPARRPERVLAIGLACLLLLVMALAAAAPFWAPALPWGPARDETAAAQDLDHIRRQAEAAQNQIAQQAVDSLKQAQQQLEQKVGQAARTAITTAVEPLDKRVAAVEAKPTVSPADLDALRQQVGKLGGAASDLAARLETLEKSVTARADNDGKDIASVLALMQIRDAVETGRPFTAQYETLAALSRDRTDIALAVAPLQDAAKNGVATRAALAARLRQIAGVIAAAPTGNRARDDWGQAVLDRLSRLVTVRRIDGGASGSSTGATPANGADSAVHRAELAMSAGNLSEAVAVLGTLSGGPAEAAAPWLQMARQRLAVETALRDTEAKLTARLGNASPGRARNAPESAG